MRRPTPLGERLQARREVTEAGCWLWTGRPNNRGYGMMTMDGKSRLVHRIAYEFYVGPIPSGLVLDHLCRVRMCFNPEHLEPVTQQENTLRSPIAPGALNAAKTHCAKGHPYDEANTYVYQSKKPRTIRRICKTCEAEYRRARAARKAAARGTQGVAA